MNRRQAVCLQTSDEMYDVMIFVIGNLLLVFIGIALAILGAIYEPSVEAEKKRL